MLEGIVDDEMDQTLALDFINNGKELVEDERPWAYLKKKTPAVTKTTTILIPEDYRRTLKIRVGTRSLSQVPFEDVEVWENASGKWSLDFGGGIIMILDPGSNGLLTHTYLKTTPDIELDTSPIFPARYHKLCVFAAAELYFAVDQGDRSRSWDDKWAVQRKLLRDSMVAWDAQLQVRAMENAIPEGLEETDYPLSMM